MPASDVGEDEILERHDLVAIGAELALADKAHRVVRGRLVERLGVGVLPIDHQDVRLVVEDRVQTDVHRFAVLRIEPSDRNRIVRTAERGEVAVGDLSHSCRRARMRCSPGSSIRKCSHPLTGLSGMVEVLLLVLEFFSIDHTRLLQQP